MSFPNPLTPRACDLQDFSFMPLQVARLRDSDFAAEQTPEECWYAVLLWCAAWHQVPAASLPDNDTLMMRICGLGRDTATWAKCKAGALRGFIKCSDGRLYHPVVAEQANQSWDGKLQQRWRMECARVKKSNERTGGDVQRPTFEEYVESLSLATNADVPAISAIRPEGQNTMSLGTNDARHGDVPSDNGSKRQGQGQGQRDSLPTRAKQEPKPGAALQSAMDACEMTNPPAGWRDAFNAWQDAGVVNFEQDALPTIKRVVAEVKAKGGKMPFSFSFFTGQIIAQLEIDARQIQRWKDSQAERAAREVAQAASDKADLAELDKLIAENEAAGIPVAGLIRQRAELA